MLLLEISITLKIPKTTIRDRIKLLGIKGERVNNTQTKLNYSIQQFDLIKDSFKKDYRPDIIKKFDRKKIVFVERYTEKIIQHTIIYHIYESKMNFIE